MCVVYCGLPKGIQHYPSSNRTLILLAGLLSRWKYHLTLSKYPTLCFFGVSGYWLEVWLTSVNYHTNVKGFDTSQPMLDANHPSSNRPLVALKPNRKIGYESVEKMARSHNFNHSRG